jgi:hypothetical protein
MLLPYHFFPQISRSISNAIEILGIDERLTSTCVHEWLNQLRIDERLMSTYVNEWLNQLPMSMRCLMTLSFALESPPILVVSALFHTSVTMPVKCLLSIYICNAVKFIILILFCFKGTLYEGKCGIFC